MVDYDVVVVGGGPGGAAAALTLGRSGVKVMLVEAQLGSQWKIGETVAPEARQVLQALGVWKKFAGDGHLRCHGTCSAWGSDQLREKDFIFNPRGCGWQLDRAKFETMLLSVSETEGVVVLRGEAVQEFKRWKGVWQVDLSSQTVRAPWLIDATGRRSMIARRMGIPRATLDQLVSLYVTASSISGTDQDSRTFIESSPEGWWYTALTPSGRRTVGFQTDADFTRDQKWRDPVWLQKKFFETQHLSSLLAVHGYIFNGSAQLTSAHSGRVEKCFGEGWLAVGDAAQSFDPLSGQGILNALGTGQMAAEALLRDWPDSNATVAAYSTSREVQWERFLKSRQQFYAMEQRWSLSPFWRQRQ